MGKKQHKHVDKNKFIDLYYLKSDNENLLMPVYNKSALLSVISVFVNIFNLTIPLFIFFVLDLFYKTKNNNLLNIIFILGIFVTILNYWMYNLRYNITLKMKKVLDYQVFNNLMDVLFSVPNATVEMKQDGFWLSLFNDIDILKNTIKPEFFTKNIDISFVAITVGLITGLSFDIAKVMLPVTGLYLLIIYFFYKKMFSISSKENIAISTRNNLIASSIKNLSSVKSSVLKDKIKSSWKDYQSNIDYRLLYKQSLINNFDNVINTVSVVCMLVLTYVLAHDVVNNKLEIAEFVFILFSVFIAFNLINKIVSIYPNYQKFNRSANRLTELFLQISQIQSKSIDMIYPVNPILKSKSIFISDNHGNPIINDLDMELHPGTLYIVKGKNPSVSSIMLKCFAGLYPVENGNIFISEYNLKDVNVRSIANYVRYLEEDPVLFYGSIKENMTCFYNYSTKEYPLLKLENLISIFHMDSVVENLPQGYNTIIDNNVDILSHEEIKLVNIIRTIIGNPSVILLDNPFSNLSHENRQQLINLLVKISKEKLIIITSSNYDSYINDSHMVFIKNGEIEIKENEFVVNNQKHRSLFRRISIH